MKDAVNLKREAVIFLLINVGISLFWRAGIALWPAVMFHTPLIYLAVIVSMLALNIRRAFTVPKFGIFYAAIAVLNVWTTIVIGNTGFLTSLRDFYLLRESLI